MASAMMGVLEQRYPDARIQAAKGRIHCDV
jgi:hypothetical protein